MSTQVTDSINTWNFRWLAILITSNPAARHAVMAAYPQEVTTDIPEHSFLDPSFWDERARGLGATTSVPVGSSAEENLLCLPDDRCWKPFFTKILL